MTSRLKLICLIYFLFSCFISCKDEGKTRYLIGFSQCTGGDKWRQTMHEEMRRELSFHPDVELLIKDAQGDNKTQKKHIQEFIAAGVDVLIVSPNEAKPVTPEVNDAFNRGIPVIIVDRRTDSKSYTTYIGADNFEIGKAAGEYIAKLLKGKGKVIEVWGLRGSTPAQNRHAGFKNIMNKYPDIEVIAEVEGEWEIETAKSGLLKVLKQHTDTDLVYAHNDMMALAAYQVAENMPSVNSNLKFIGVDALPGPNGGIQFVADNMVDATFLYPTGGEEAIRTAINILEGKVVDKEDMLETIVIDSSNVRVMQLQTSKIINQQKSIQRQQAMLDEQTRLYRIQRFVLWGILAVLVGIVFLGTYILSRLRTKYEAEIRKKETVENYNYSVKEKKQYNNAAETPKVVQENPDNIFLKKLNDIIHENLSDSTLNVAMICKALGMSRIQVYRKVKSLLDCGVNDYIKTVRLDKAKTLLSEKNNLSISEIAYQTGFSSPAYFSTTFKAKYKISPSEVQNKA